MSPAPLAGTTGAGSAVGRPATPQVSWHGHIHNGAELAAQLGLPAGTALAEVLAGAWQRWGTGSFSRIDGVYALVLRDGERTVAYREPSGLRDLLITQTPGQPAQHAHHLDTLVSTTPNGHALDSAAAQEYLRLLEVAAPNTWHRGVRSLEAGHLAHWMGDGPVQIEAVPAPDGGAMPTSFEAAVAEVDRRLQHSVQGHLLNARSPAAFLSGGVDSALLCALAAPIRPDLCAVTVGFVGDRFDETPVAQRIAAHLGLRHVALRFDRGQFLHAFDRLSREASQPMADPAAMATVLAFTHCAQRHDVVLDGTGADEAVGMMPPRHVRLAVAQASRLPTPVRRAVAGLLRRLPRLSAYAPVFDFDHPADTMSRWHGFTRAEIQRLCHAPDALDRAQFYRVFARYPRHAHFARFSALQETLTCDRLNVALALTDAPVRFPFWDQSPHRYLRQLPVPYRFQPGQPKRILRAVLARHLPPALWNHPKHSFDFPLHDFLTGDDHALVREHLAPARWQRHALLDVAEVTHYAQRFIAGDQRITFRIWALVVLGAWLTQHEDRLDAPA